MVSSLDTDRRRGITAGGAFVVMAGLLALLWLLEVVDQASGNSLDRYGIRARDRRRTVAHLHRPRCCTAAGRT